MPKGTRLGKLHSGKFEEQEQNHQLFCGDDNLVSQRGPFRQFEV